MKNKTQAWNAHTPHSYKLGGYKNREVRGDGN